MRGAHCQASIREGRRAKKLWSYTEPEARFTVNTATFGGRKFKHDSLVRRLRSKRNIRVEIVDEAYTSQACSSCNEKTEPFSKIVLNHRMRCGVCPNCGSVFDRDATAANILVN